MTQQCTKSQYEQLERERAEAVAPSGEISEDTFRATLRTYPLSTVRLASMRYSPCRGSWDKVIDRFVEVLANHHVNRGDDYRIALGHVEATFRGNG
jgi:hypothetical protein